LATLSTLEQEKKKEKEKEKKEKEKEKEKMTKYQEKNVPQPPNPHFLLPFPGVVFVLVQENDVQRVRFLCRDGPFRLHCFLTLANLEKNAGNKASTFTFPAAKSRNRGCN
jgi:hypothetical protein